MSSNATKSPLPTTSELDNDIYSLPAPTLAFDSEGVPGSSEFDDVYFSRDDGLAETEYIFLHHNHLEERWISLNTNGFGEFVIGETGFGTGLNFLAAVKLWLKIAPVNWQLHFISTELYPLKSNQLQEALDFWPQLKREADELLRSYPPRLRGMHSVSLFDNRIKLQLHFGDAAESLAKVLSPANGLIDAWFLDGFAPAKNPGMWHPALFLEIGRLSKPQATVTTFTVAGIVKNGLRDAGFIIEKVPGHGRKRQMLRGTYQESKSKSDNPLPFWAKPLSTKNSKARVTIIGAGLAGCTTAHALAKRGYHITLIDRESTSAQAASGNAQGVLYCTLSPKPNKINRFALSSYLYARDHYRHLLERMSVKGELCGHLELLRNDNDQQLAEKLKQLLIDHPDLCRWLDSTAASELAGIPVTYPALFFPGAGWISPPDLCHKLIQHPLIKTIFHTEIVSLQRNNDSWQLHDNSNQLINEADIVIIANASDASQFSQTSWLPLKPVRGQTTVINANEISNRLRTVICHDGYIAPQSDGEHCIGATFDLHNLDKTSRDIDDQINIDSLKEALSGMFDADESPAPIANRVGFRTTTPDYLPLCGAVPIVKDFLRDYDKLRYDARFDIAISGSYWPGLFLNTGHGARGLGYTPICADWLASLIDDGVRPLTSDMCLSIHPGRFIIKGIIRNKL